MKTTIRNLRGHCNEGVSGVPKGGGGSKGPDKGWWAPTARQVCIGIEALYHNLLRDAIELLALGRLSMWAWIEIDLIRLIPSTSNLI